MVQLDADGLPSRPSTKRPYNSEQDSSRQRRRSQSPPRRYRRSASPPSRDYKSRERREDRRDERRDERSADYEGQRARYREGDRENDRRKYADRPPNEDSRRPEGARQESTSKYADMRSITVPKGMPAPPSKNANPTGGKVSRMIEIIANDRLGGKGESLFISSNKFYR